MGSPLGPTLADIFLRHHETTWLKNFSKTFKLVYYKRYVDDSFVLFEKPEQVLQFVNCMTKNTEVLNFRIKLKKDNSFSFLYVKICREKDKFYNKCFQKSYVQ